MKRLLLVLIACLTFAPQARAAQAQSQPQGRVVVDNAIIGRAEASIAITSVKAGTVLELTGRSDRWYEVVVPPALGGGGQRGLIARTQVQLVPGSEIGRAS